MDACLYYNKDVYTRVWYRYWFGVKWQISVGHCLERDEREKKKVQTRGLPKGCF